ncbi:MAG: hypothetical protein H7X79_01765 [Sporomusaceae bacterium]|nr:hypothetical protein [Sporomusaceae bacterium]
MKRLCLLLVVLLLATIGTLLSMKNTENSKKDFETRIFYGRDTLLTDSIYEGLAKNEKDPVKKVRYEKAAKIMEQKIILFNQVEKDFKEGRGTFEEWNKRLDELMAISPYGTPNSP